MTGFAAVLVIAAAAGGGGGGGEDSFVFVLDISNVECDVWTFGRRCFRSRP